LILPSIMSRTCWYVPWSPVSRGSQPNPQSFSAVAASPKYDFIRLTTYDSAFDQNPFCPGWRIPSTHCWNVSSCWHCGIGRYPGSRLNSVGMSVEPWMLACPRSASTPPPGRPMLPSSS